jgi:small subunit ribosomal protein S17
MNTIKGKVKSDKMAETVVVEVVRTIEHPKYYKRVKKSKRYHAHNDVGAKTGDVVELVPTRPLSATKNWKVTKIYK